MIFSSVAQDLACVVRIYSHLLFVANASTEERRPVLVKFPTLIS